ncbi:MAG: aldo/keto reductase [Bacillales bacterium]|jgi:predicted oxidoreductase|nr:aldo/keto reductase [Bacillales bacterium]
MKYIELTDNLKVSKIALGCMRTNVLNVDQLEELILTALELGINFFDHADIYGDGQCETLFGEVLKRNPSLRSKIYLQSKVGIIKGHRYDFSKEHILKTVNAQLKRLNTNYLDFLLLHRPDVLVDYQEVNEAFDELYSQGKVKYFGVSNFNAFQMELYQSKVKYPLIFNQVQLSITESRLVDEGIYVNQKNDLSLSRSNGILEYTQMKNIILQPWSVIMAGAGEGTFIDNPKYLELNKRLEVLANKYQVEKNAIAIAWLLRFPQPIQPIVGTTSIKHLKEMSKAVDIKLDREEWYSLYLANKLIP